MYLITEDKQEAFDIVARHLHEMIGRSVDPDLNACQYLSENGNKCAAGVLMTDDGLDYVSRRDMNNSMFTEFREWNIDRNFTLFVSRLQRAHDTLDNWNTAKRYKNWELLREIARDYKLNTKVLFELGVENV